MFCPCLTGPFCGPLRGFPLSPGRASLLPEQRPNAASAWIFVWSFLPYFAELSVAGDRSPALSGLSRRGMTGSRDREGRAVRVSPPQRGGAAAASSPRPQGFVSHAAACLVSRGSLGDPRRWTRHQRVVATPRGKPCGGRGLWHGECSVSSTQEVARDFLSKLVVQNWFQGPV